MEKTRYELNKELAQMLKGGVIMDVTTPEPLPQDSPLWDIPDLLITPDVAGGMRLEITRRTCILMAQDNLKRYLAGQPLENLVEG